MVDKELIGIWKKTLKSSISSWLLKTNYEGLGEQDKEEFERDFDEILDLALVGLKYKAQLSQEGTTKDATSDTISRQAAIDAVDAIGHIATMPDGDKCIRRSAVKYTLSMLPSAQPERKTGHWILYDKRFPWSKDYKCSECGNYINISDINAGRGSANFCPNCGADMRGAKVKCGDEDTLQGGLMSAT